MERFGLRTFLHRHGQRSGRDNNRTFLRVLVDCLDCLASLTSEQLHVVENEATKTRLPRADSAPRPRESDERDAEVHRRRHLLLDVLRAESRDVAHRGGSKREQEGDYTGGSAFGRQEAC